MCTCVYGLYIYTVHCTLGLLWSLITLRHHLHIINVSLCCHWCAIFKVTPLETSDLEKKKRLKNLCTSTVIFLVFSKEGNLLWILFLKVSVQSWKLFLLSPAGNIGLKVMVSRVTRCPHILKTNSVEFHVIL